jgi:hypothetical protein
MGRSEIPAVRDLECCRYPSLILEYWWFFVLMKAIGMTGPKDKNNHRPAKSVCYKQPYVRSWATEGWR